MTDYATENLLLRPSETFASNQKKHPQMQPKNFGGTFVVVLRLQFNAAEKGAVQGTKTRNRAHNCLGSHGIEMIVVIIEIF